MTFFKRFLAAWRQAKSQIKYDEFADMETGWLPEDANWLLQTLDSTHGRRLKARLANVVLRAAWDACSQPQNGDWHRGKANGIAQLVQVIEQHSNSELYVQEKQISPSEAYSEPFEIPETAPVL